MIDDFLGKIRGFLLHVEYNLGKILLQNQIIFITDGNRTDGAFQLTENLFSKTTFFTSKLLFKLLDLCTQSLLTLLKLLLFLLFGFGSQKRITA